MSGFEINANFAVGTNKDLPVGKGAARTNDKNIQLYGAKSEPTDVDALPQGYTIEKTTSPDGAGKKVEKQDKPPRQKVILTQGYTGMGTVEHKDGLTIKTIYDKRNPDVPMASETTDADGKLVSTMEKYFWEEASESVMKIATYYPNGRIENITKYRNDRYNRYPTEEKYEMKTVYAFDESGNALPVISYDQDGNVVD